MQLLDQNSDGVLSEYEFVQALESALKGQVEFNKIMEDIKINNPVVLEERILDLDVRRKYLESQMKGQEQISQKKSVHYEKVLSELKVEEEKYKKRQNIKQKPNTQQLQASISQLRSQVRELEDDCDKR